MPLVGLTIQGVFRELDHERELSEQAALQIAKVTAAGVSQFLSDAERSLRGIADHPDIRAFDSERCLVLVEHSRAALAQFLNVWVNDGNGGLTCTAAAPRPEGPLPGVADRPYFQEIMGGASFVIGAPQVGRITGQTVSVVAVPVFSDSGDIVGLVGAAVDLARFQELLRSPELTQGSVLTLAHIDGVIVARSDDAERWVGEDFHPPGRSRTDYLAEEGFRVSLGVDGVERAGGWRAVEGSEWIVYAGVPTAQITAGIWRRSRGRLALRATLLMLLVVLFMGLYRRVHRSLRRLRTDAEDAARGKPITLDPRDPAEVREIAQAFSKTMKERGEALEELRRSQQRHKSVFDNALFAIYVANDSGRILEANPALAKLLGFDSVASLIGYSMVDLYADDDERERLVTEARGKSKAIMETRWRRTNGTMVPVRIHVSRVILPSGETAHEVIAEDLSERQHLEDQFRQAQKLEAVGRLSGGIAHDFNNRLTVIQGEAGVLLEQLPEGSAFRQSVLAIADSAEMAERLTAKLLAFSRKQVVYVEALDLNSLISGVSEVLQRLIGDDVVLELLSDDSIGMIRHDRGQVEQVLMNLATNARDAMPLGGTLTLATKREVVDADDARIELDLRAGTYAVMTVTDTGSGMTEEVRLNALEPFFTTKDRSRGTGLGLSSVYAIVAGGGGRVRLLSSPGNGTTVELWFPQAGGTSKDSESHVAAS